jgi:hypothetical protein
MICLATGSALRVSGENVLKFVPLSVLKGSKFRLVELEAWARVGGQGSSEQIENCAVDKEANMVPSAPKQGRQKQTKRWVDLVTTGGWQAAQ